MSRLANSGTGNNNRCDSAAALCSSSRQTTPPAISPTLPTTTQSQQVNQAATIVGDDSVTSVWHRVQQQQQQQSNLAEKRRDSPIGCSSDVSLKQPLIVRSTTTSTTTTVLDEKKSSATSAQQPGTSCLAASPAPAKSSCLFGPAELNNNTANYYSGYSLFAPSSKLLRMPIDRKTTGTTTAMDSAQKSPVQGDRIDASKGSNSNNIIRSNGPPSLKKQANNVWSNESSKSVISKTIVMASSKQQQQQESPVANKQARPVYKSTRLDDIDLGRGSGTGEDDSDSESTASSSTASSLDSQQAQEERLIHSAGGVAPGNGTYHSGNNERYVDGHQSQQVVRHLKQPTSMTTKGKGNRPADSSNHSNNTNNKSSPVKKQSHGSKLMSAPNGSAVGHTKISLGETRQHSRSFSNNKLSNKNCLKNAKSYEANWRQSSEPIINDLIYTCDCEDCDQKRKLALAEVYRAMAHVSQTGSAACFTTSASSGSNKAMYPKTRFVHLVLRSIILTLCTILLLLLLIGTIIVSHHLPQAFERMMNVSRSFNVTIAGRK